MMEEKRARSTVSSGETLMIFEFPSPCESFHANSLINQELLPVDVLDFVNSQNVFHHETHSRSAGSCCGAGTAGSCPTSRRAGPAGRRPCRLCTATETSRRVRPSAPATTRKPEEDESGRKVKNYTGSCVTITITNCIFTDSREILFSLRRLKHFQKAACKSVTSENVHGG